MSQIPPHKENEMEKKLKQKYIPHEELERECLRRADYQICKAFLTYSHDPVGMFRNKDWKAYVIPFSRYLKGEINFEEARAEKEKFLKYDSVELADFWILHWQSVFYEMKTGRNFENDLKTLREGDERDKKEVALSLVSAFKSALQGGNADIDALLEKAWIEGDKSFSNALFDPSISKHPDKKRWPKLLHFARLNEDAILKRSMSQDEIVDLARSQGVLSKIPPKNKVEAKKEKDRLLRYLQRCGIKKESPGRPHESDKPELSEDDRLLCLELEKHQIEFFFYLLNPDGEEIAKKYIKSVEKFGLNFK